MKKIISIKRAAMTGAFLTVSLILFLNSFSFRDNVLIPESGGWQLQTNLQTLLNGRTITDMTFLDSLTGFVVCGILTESDTGFVFKTTNGGNNWFISYSNPTLYTNIFKKIIFVNDSIGYACGSGGEGFMCKTTDRGNNWTKNIYGWVTGFRSMSILGKDTIYATDDDALVGGVFRSTNGGGNWQRIYNAGQYNPQNIYMINGMTGFYDKFNTYKTTDGGFSWAYLDDMGFHYMKFLDSLNGYRIANGGDVQKTTNAGDNWITLSFPNVPGVYTSKYMQNLSFLGRDTIWAAGGYLEYLNPYRNFAILYRTTNGGLNWGYQIPDTSAIHILRYYFVDFKNKNNGWAYYSLGLGIHTTVGGDSTIYLGVRQISGETPEKHSLEQNYPNPFNSISKIKYQILKTANIKIVIFDITGKEIYAAVNERQTTGIYETTFDGCFLSSGVYFYSLYADGIRIQTRKMLMIK